MPARAEGPQQLRHSKDVDGSREVVRQASEAEFSSTVLAPLHEEIALIIGVCDRATWVFHALLALLHERGVGFEPLLHALEAVLIDPAGNSTFVAGALLLNGTAPACTRGIVADMTAACSGRTLKSQLLAARTPLAVLLRVRGEALFAKASQLGVG